MAVYRGVWLSLLGVLAAVGLTIAAVSMSLAALIPLVLCAAIFGPLIAAGVHGQTHPGTSMPSRYWLAVTAATAVGALAIAGLILAAGATALLGAALLAVVSPPVLGRLLPRRSPQAPTPEDRSAGKSPAASEAAKSSQASGASAPLPPVPALPSYSSLTDAELCWRWRTSFSALQHSASDAERVRLIETRSALLDELAARDADGFARWMSSGARAASDPARFLTPHRGDRPGPRGTQ